MYIYLSVSLFTQRAICIWIPVNTGAWVKPYKTNSLTQKYSGNSSSPSSWKDGWISIGLEPLLGFQVETIVGLCLLNLARQLGCFWFKWVLNVFLCFSPALNLESWYMEHYPWCWKRTGYQVEVSIRTPLSKKALSDSQKPAQKSKSRLVMTSIP